MLIDHFSVLAAPYCGTVVHAVCLNLSEPSTKTTKKHRLYQQIEMVYFKVLTSVFKIIQLLLIKKIKILLLHPKYVIESLDLANKK